MYETIFKLKVKLGCETNLLTAIDIEMPNGMIVWLLMKSGNESAEQWR
tara:strand:+ start:174 stop:317 length:144 start_codon:yes stop_codon:yes gene_type:complete